MQRVNGFLLILYLTLTLTQGYGETQAAQLFYQRVVAIAKESVGLESVPSYGDKHFTCDCIGFIRYVYAKAGVDLVSAYGIGRGGVSSLYNGLLKRGFVYQTKLPQLGDLIIFDNTYDVNRNGAWDDPLTHIAIVSEIDRHHTIHYIHYASGRVNEERLNLYYPNTHAFKQSNGKLFVINSYLRRNRGEGFEKKQYVASSFYRAFAHIKVKFKNSQDAQETAYHESNP